MQRDSRRDILPLAHLGGNSSASKMLLPCHRMVNRSEGLRRSVGVSLALVSALRKFVDDSMKPVLDTIRR